MPTPALLWHLFLETLAPRTLERKPEEDLVMDGKDEVAAYAETGRTDSPMAAVYLFHAARVSQVIAGAKTVVDLACGPCTQLAEIAALNPETNFIGVDLSDEMLEAARPYLAERNLSNVSVVTDDVTRLTKIADRSADAVISTVALHHLPDYGHLEGCFRQIARILKPGGAVYLADFSRMKSAKTVLFLAYMDREHQPELFSRDYERSLRAAFLLDDFKRLAKQELPDSLKAKVYRTFLVPLFTLVKTPDRILRPDQATKLRERRNALPARYRHELDDLRTFFKLGGLPNDPFAA